MRADALSLVSKFEWERTREGDETRLSSDLYESNKYSGLPIALGGQMYKDLLASFDLSLTI